MPNKTQKGNNRTSNSNRSFLLCFRPLLNALALPSIFLMHAPNANWHLMTTHIASPQELQLHLGVLQQHAALIGGPNATSCPVCHKLFLGTDALLDHMKHVHKEKSPTPTEPRKQPHINGFSLHWVSHSIIVSLHSCSIW